MTYWNKKEIEDIRAIEIEYRNFMDKWNERLKYISSNEVLFMLYRLGKLCEKTISSRFKNVDLKAINKHNICNITGLYFKLCECHKDYYNKLIAWFFRFPAYLLFDEKKCMICGKEFNFWYDLTIDHIVPISKGGLEFDPTNLQLACRKCNSRKGASIKPKWGNVPNTLKLSDFIEGV